MSKTLTPAQYYAVHGLLALSCAYNKKIEDLVKALAEILDEPENSQNYYGHVSDAVYGSHGPDELLRLLDFNVPKPLRAGKK